VANLRTVNTAEVTYLSSSGGTYGDMPNLISAKLLDDTFTGTKAGYKYGITLDVTGQDYTATAYPAAPNTGRYGYYSVPDAVVRYSTSGCWYASSSARRRWNKLGPKNSQRAR